MLRVARTLTGNQADAEDLVQETVIRAFRALDRFDGAHPRAWPLTILRHTSMNMHRRRRPDLVQDWAAVQGARPAFGARGVPSAEDTVLNRILSEDLEKRWAPWMPGSARAAAGRCRPAHLRRGR